MANRLYGAVVVVVEVLVVEVLVEVVVVGFGKRQATRAAIRASATQRPEGGVMSYALFYDVPADAKMYRQVKAAIGDEQPKGLVVHLVVQVETGLRHIGVWESEADWQRFHDERVEPAVHTVLTAAGFTELPPDPPVEELELVDVWLGA